MFDFSIAVEITYSRESTKCSHSRNFFRAYSPAELIFLRKKYQFNFKRNSNSNS